MKSARTSICLGLVCLSTLAGAESNILTNGGFEMGLMCYGNWVWSYSGLPYLGDHKFNLSTDAHSGVYSLEIACGGPDCVKGSIFHNNIATLPNQTYTLSTYAKCPANTFNFIYIPDSVRGSFAQTITCNGNWTLNQVTFTTAPGAQDFSFAFYNADTSWLRLDDVVLTYADGTVPQQPVAYPGIRPVTISGGNVMVDGKPYLSLGFVDVPYSELSAAAATGANTLNGLGNSGSAACFNTALPSYLDRAYSLGLNFLPDSTTSTRLGAPNIFPSIARNLGEHKAVIGWSLADEPDHVLVPFQYIPPSTVNTAYAALKSALGVPITLDSQHAAYDTASSVAPYTTAADFWMAEPYGSDFSGIDHAVSLCNSLQPKPIWIYQDAITPA